MSEDLAKIIKTKKGQKVVIPSPNCSSSLFQQVTRAQAMKKLWAYIKEKGLKVIPQYIFYSICTNLHTFEDPEDKSQFTPDKNMQPIFGSSKQLCSGMSKLIKNHLTKN